MSPTLSHEFVDAIPERPGADTVYISIAYGTAVHLCCCGCGREVVTPITPDDWSLTYDGAAISLSPSIGNWSFECRSHYFITKSRVRWAATWTDSMVDATREGHGGLTRTRSEPDASGTRRGVGAWLRAALSRILQGGR